MRRALSVALGAGLGLLLVWVAFRGVHAGELFASLKAFEWGWAPVLLALPVLDLWARALRWRILLAPVADARAGKLLQLEAVGLALNNVLFMRLGEPARALLAGLELDVHAFAV
ncbi:MAG: flippase-like domain-containing protein, partial [Elusimicrobia bacterium]|nr:flippase-like domain-containing protein [Elusimicrobiota bacterium]